MDNVMLSVESPKDSTKKLLELKSESSKAKGYKINIQKSTVFLDTKSNQPKNEIKKTTPFIIASKRKKILKDKLNKRHVKLILQKLQNTVDRN